MTTKKIIWLVLAIGASSALVVAQESTSKVEGTLTLDKKTYTLKHVVAYETTIDREDATAVVFSAQPVTSEQLNEARAAEKGMNDPEFKRPFLRLVYTKTGEIKHWSAGTSSTMIGRRSGTATGELKQQDGRVTGSAAVKDDEQGMFPSSFDVRFETALVKTGESLPASAAKRGGPAANVKPTVTGTFKGNGKEANLAYVSAHWTEPFSGKQGIELVFTEKDHSKDKKPDMGATFGRFGNALIISIFEDGGIYGCQVVHMAHQKQGFSSVGRIESTEFSYADGKVEGEITTHGELDAFGEKWDVNIKFVAPLGEVPKEFQVAETKKPEKSATPASTDSDDDDSEDEEDDEGAPVTATSPARAPKKSAAPALSVKELALTKDASDVEYKAIVEQLGFKSKADPKNVCTELAAGLKAQGWATEGRDMVNPNSSILRRKRGDASLTIFVKPASGGSEIKMMTEGLSWEGQ